MLFCLQGECWAWPQLSEWPVLFWLERCWWIVVSELMIYYQFFFWNYKITQRIGLFWQLSRNFRWLGTPYPFLFWQVTLEIGNITWIAENTRILALSQSPTTSHLENLLMIMYLVHRHLLFFQLTISFLNIAHNSLFTLIINQLFQHGKSFCPFQLILTRILLRFNNLVIFCRYHINSSLFLWSGFQSGTVLLLQWFNNLCFLFLNRGNDLICVR